MRGRFEKTVRLMIPGMVVRAEVRNSMDPENSYSKLVFVSPGEIVFMWCRVSDPAGAKRPLRRSAPRTGLETRPHMDSAKSARPVTRRPGTRASRPQQLIDYLCIGFKRLCGRDARVPGNGPVLCDLSALPAKPRFIGNVV